MSSEFRRGDENRPPTPRFRKHPVEWQNIPPHKAKNHPPADTTSSGRVIDIMGAGMGCVPFNRVLAKIRGCGRFSSPLRNSDFFTGYVHRRTLPQGGSRGGAVPFNRVLAEIVGCGRFSSSLRNSEDVKLYHSSKYAGAITNRSRGFFWLGWGGGVCGWLCFQSGGSVPGLRRKSDPLLPGYGCGRRTCRSASAARRPPAR